MERARRACEDGTAKRQRKGPKDPMRFVSSTSVTEEGEVAERCIRSIDDRKVEEEASWDGFYGLVSCNLLVDSGTAGTGNRYALSRYPPTNTSRLER